MPTQLLLLNPWQLSGPTIDQFNQWGYDIVLDTRSVEQLLIGQGFPPADVMLVWVNGRKTKQLQMLVQQCNQGAYPIVYGVRQATPHLLKTLGINHSWSYVTLSGSPSQWCSAIALSLYHFGKKLQQNNSQEPVEVTVQTPLGRKGCGLRPLVSPLGGSERLPVEQSSLRKHQQELQTLVDKLSQDLETRDRTEQQLKNTLTEKEVLLKEIHHRVKNNLQVISSLLSWQTRQIQDATTLSILEESRNRIMAMALVHEQMYQSPDLVRVNFGEYVRRLINNLASFYAQRTAHIEICMNIQPVTLNLETAMPCGLILYELVSNAFKHGFPNGRQGKIQVDIQDRGDTSYHIKVADNGVGLPASLKLAQFESMGLQLVQGLAEQLEGQLEWKGDRGTIFSLTFAELNYEKIT